MKLENKQLLLRVMLMFQFRNLPATFFVDHPQYDKQETRKIFEELYEDILREVK